MRPPALDGEHIAGAVGRVRPRYVVIMELIARHHVPRGASRGEFTNGLGRVLVLRGGHEPQQSAGQILIAQRVRTAGSKSASDRAQIRCLASGTGSPVRLHHAVSRPALDAQQLLDDDLDAAVLRLTHTRTRWHQQMRVAEALDSDGACRHAVLDQFGLHGLGTAYR